MDGEMYECVKSFCYLGDDLDGDGGADLTVTARIRNGWMKFRELLPFLTSRAPPLEMKGRVYASCVRSSMTYGSETRPLLVDVGLKFERPEMQMITPRRKKQQTTPQTLTQPPTPKLRQT